MISNQKNTEKINKPKNRFIFDPDLNLSCFIGGVPINMSENELFDIVKSKFPKINIREIKLIPQKNKKGFNKGFGFITGETSKDQEELLQSELKIGEHKVFFILILRLK